MSKLQPARNHPQQVARRQRATLFGDVDLTDEVDDRGTPQKLFGELDTEFRFTVDVAASATNAKCERFYDIAADGLSKSWADERVFCNPPYSDLPSWIRKAHQETDAEVIVMLIPANRTEQPFWQTYIEPYRDGGGASREPVLARTHEVRDRRSADDGDAELRVLRARLETRFINGRLNFKTPGGKFGRVPFGSVLVIWR